MAKARATEQPERTPCSQGITEHLAVDEYRRPFDTACNVVGPRVLYHVGLQQASASCQALLSKVVQKHRLDM